VIGTIPPQHMFGLETTIMLPWQNGMSVYPKRPLLPADLDAAAVSADTPRWLMTSPIHLRACIADGLSVRGLVGAISSTMPLDPALARAAEGLWDIPVLEIYGSTEAGMIALRRPARDERWQLCEGLRLRAQGSRLWVEGGHIATPQQIADQVTQQDDRHFTLHGRTSDIIKIAGKRTTLAALNAVLNRIEGVQDGVFFVPEGRAKARLAAFVVAPDRSVVEIRAALRQHVDPAFLPRPLRLVSRLPREATGKIPRQTLVDLAATLRDPEYAG
jgi:acyl-coenzyme A synthetase/AMP-(fatty) acid ligase